jgi:hypothetical protein
VPTIRDEIHRLLPMGSRPGQSKGYSQCPLWPPDLFAVAASLVSASQCFTWPKYLAGWDRRYYVKNEYVDEMIAIGKSWRDTTEIPEKLANRWSKLVEFGDSRIFDPDTHQRPWTEIVMSLLAIADEAAAGIGFGGWNAFARFLIQQNLQYLTGRGRLLLPNIPHSVCMMVPLEEASVLPKSNTPQVGCTMRSLSHNLALLPRERSVGTSWLLQTGPEEDSESRPFNVLLVPFPYALKGKDFDSHRAAMPSETTDALDYFTINQSWLRNGSRKISAAAIARFLCNLVDSARREVSEIHAVVLPEAALEVDLADRVAKLIAKRNPELEIFITGAISAKGQRSRNLACTYRLLKGAVLQHPKQSKHHRWGLETSQIRRYHLGHVLDPSSTWWEQIDVDGRKVAFYVVREGASLAVLVCEDLARYDPVMPTLLAVGPNLVVALLMDGPQLERRWPGRYATVLAEDPGSSVLTLTSLGMVNR